MRSDCIIPKIKEEAVNLLITTKLSHDEIGKRLGCSRGPIYDIYRDCKISGVIRDNIKKNGKLIKCKKCGNNFYMPVGHLTRGRGQFCSKECYSSWQRSPYNKGRNHPNWKPGIKREKLAHRSRKSKSWKIWRSKVYNRDNYICVLCGKTRCLVDPHHILPRRDFPKLKYIKSNGCTLCRECHQKTFGNEYKFVELLVNKIFGGLKQWKLTGHWMMLRKQRKIGYKAQ